MKIKLSEIEINLRYLFGCAFLLTFPFLFPGNDNISLKVSLGIYGVIAFTIFELILLTLENKIDRKKK